MYRVFAKYSMLCVLCIHSAGDRRMALEGDTYMSMAVVMLMALFMVFCVLTFVRGE